MKPQVFHNPNSFSIVVDFLGSFSPVTLYTMVTAHYICASYFLVHFFGHLYEEMLQKSDTRNDFKKWPQRSLASSSWPGGILNGRKGARKKIYPSFPKIILGGVGLCGYNLQKNWNQRYTAPSFLAKKLQERRIQKELKKMWHKENLKKSYVKELSSSHFVEGWGRHKKI